MKKIIFLISILSTSLSFAAEPIHTGLFSNVAISGYDTVAYFTEGKPVKGLKQHSIEWNGAEWQFASNENLALFQQNPEKYAPQYGGYCAFAVAHDSLAAGDPQQWYIQSGKLYLNLNTGIQQKWLSNKDEFIPLADQYFPDLIN
ncbi:MAG: YHS domain-containing (seleno)protein [Pseudomonadota bacterium]